MSQQTASPNRKADWCRSVTRIWSNGGTARGDRYPARMHEADVPPSAPNGSEHRTQTVVLIPVKSFRTAKQRLAPALDEQARAALARRMADAVADAAGPLPLAVVCDDDEVREWAMTRQALVLPDNGQGLSVAVQNGVAALALHGFESVIVAHGDLPHARSLAWVAAFDGITLVPDRHRDGTNVIALPASCGFCFAYGIGSFSRHIAEAKRLGLNTRVIDDADLSVDVDTPADLFTLDRDCRYPRPS